VPVLPLRTILTLRHARVWAQVMEPRAFEVHALVRLVLALVPARGRETAAGASFDRNLLRRVAGAAFDKVASPGSNLTVTPQVLADWGTGYCEQITIANTSTTQQVTGWQVAIQDGVDGARVQGTRTTEWNCTFAVQPSSSGQLILGPKSYNTVIYARSNVVCGFCAKVP
jgi:cellulase/cellobiase CelA1